MGPIYRQKIALHFVFKKPFILFFHCFLTCLSKQNHFARNIQDVSSLRFVPLSTNPIRFPDPTPSEPLSQFTLEHAISGGSNLFNPNQPVRGQPPLRPPIREEPRAINSQPTRGRVITPEPIRVTPLPPLNEIDELIAPRPKGSKSRQPARQPVVPNPAIINTVQNDFIATTPFPPVKNVITQKINTWGKGFLLES